MFKLSFCVLISLISLSKARKTCSDVICPDYEISLDKTVFEISKSYFERDLPENGICLDGKDKNIAYGHFFGYPGKTRCACVPGDGPDAVAEFMECVPGVPQCPKSIDVYQDETLGDYYKRMGATYKKEGITDGCCPKGFKKWIVDPSVTGADHKLCYCEPANDKISVFEGKPKFCSESSSSEEK
jgi:hypothetical protein